MVREVQPLEKLIREVENYLFTGKKIDDETMLQILDTLYALRLLGAK